jgi:hypothetical protein
MAIRRRGPSHLAIPVFNFNNLTFSNARGVNNITLPSGIVGIAGIFSPTATFGGGGYVITGNTVDYNGAAAQSMPPAFNPYNNLTISNVSVAGVTGFAGLTVQGLLKVNAGSKFTSSTSFVNVQIDGTLVGTNGTSMDVSGNWTNNGTFTPNGNTVNFNGTGAQTIGGTQNTPFDNLTIANSGGGVTLAQNETVNMLLTLTSDLNTGTFTLTQPSEAPASMGSADVVGNITRTGAPLPLTSLTYGNPENQISFGAGTPPTSINIRLTKTVPTPASTGVPNSGFSSAIARTYVITPTGGSGFSANLQLHYTAGDLNGNTAGNLKFWKFITSPSTVWQQQLGSVDNGSSNVSLAGVTAFSPWTMANANPSAANGNISGHIADDNGNPIEGAAVRLTGTQNRLTVTDAQGNYRFDEVETNGLYAVTPTRVNFTFNPSQRAFSQQGQHTEAGFTAAADGGSLSPLDTTTYFVRQHYVDFLGREPDEAGFNFWVNNIESCGSNAACREVKRIDTSAAFFLSIEFQHTGYLVYRTYQAAYGDISNTPIPVTRGELIPDAREIGNGLIVNQPGWEQVLINNKAAFANEFVQRTRFASVYPTSLSPSGFADRLFANAGIRLLIRTILQRSQNLAVLATPLMLGREPGRCNGSQRTQPSLSGNLIQRSC